MARPTDQPVPSARPTGFPAPGGLRSRPYVGGDWDAFVAEVHAAGLRPEPQPAVLPRGGREAADRLFRALGVSADAGGEMQMAAMLPRWAQDRVDRRLNDLPGGPGGGVAPSGRGARPPDVPQRPAAPDAAGRPASQISGDAPSRGPGIRSRNSGPQSAEPAGDAAPNAHRAGEAMRGRDIGTMNSVTHSNLPSRQEFAQRWEENGEAENVPRFADGRYVTGTQGKVIGFAVEVRDGPGASSLFHSQQGVDQNSPNNPQLGGDSTEHRRHNAIAAADIPHDVTSNHPMSQMPGGGDSSGPPGGDPTLGYVWIPETQRFDRRIFRLPMDDASREERAIRGGWLPENTVYHASPNSFAAFDPALTGYQTNAPSAYAGIYTSQNPKYPSWYAEEMIKRGLGDPQIYPLRFRANRVGIYSVNGNESEVEVRVNLENAFEDGFDAVLIKNPKRPDEGVLVVKNPNQLRSPHAEFDPEKYESSDLLALDDHSFRRVLAGRARAGG